MPEPESENRRWPMIRVGGNLVADRKLPDEPLPSPGQLVRGETYVPLDSIRERLMSEDALAAFHQTNSAVDWDVAPPKRHREVKRAMKAALDAAFPQPEQKGQ